MVITIGTVLLTVSATRLLEYFIFDRKKADDKGVWAHDEDIPEVPAGEV